MTDLSVWTEGHPPPTGQRHRRRKKKDRRGGLAVVLSLVLILVVVGGGSALAFGAGSKLKDMFHSTSAGDYAGPGSGSVQEPGLVAMAPGSGDIMMPPVSVCHHVSTIGQRSPPILR